MIQDHASLSLFYENILTNPHSWGFVFIGYGIVLLICLASVLKVIKEIRYNAKTIKMNMPK